MELLDAPFPRTFDALTEIDGVVSPAPRHPARPRPAPHDRETRDTHRERTDDLDEHDRPRQRGDAGVVRADEGVAERAPLGQEVHRGDAERDGHTGRRPRAAARDRFPTMTSDRDGDADRGREVARPRAPAASRRRSRGAGGRRCAAPARARRRGRSTADTVVVSHGFLQCAGPIGTRPGGPAALTR